MDGLAWDIVLKILTIIGTVTTILTGAVAIWLSLYFYRRSNEVNNAIISIVSRIEASSKTTEVTSNHFTGRLLDVVTGTLDHKHLEEIEERLTLRIFERINPVLQAAPPRLSQEATKGVHKELSDVFAKLKVEAAPNSIDFNWGPFIRKMVEIEGKQKFLSIKWLNETRFAGDPSSREALQVALKIGILKSFKLDNPHNPHFKTTCCALDRQNAIVKQVLNLHGKRAGSSV